MEKKLTVYGADDFSYCSQYYYDYDSLHWVKIGEYHILTDWALDIVSSNLDVYNSQGEVVYEASQPINDQHYIPSRDGWGFGNYRTDEPVSEDLFYRIYKRGSFLNWKTYLMHKNGPAGGLCEGVALSSILTYMNSPALSTWGKNDASQASAFRYHSDLNLYSPSIDYTLNDYIEALWLYQFSYDSAKQISEHKNQYNEIVAKVKAFSAMGENPIAIVLNIWEGSPKGHVLIPYAITKMSDADLVYVYDCNDVIIGESPDNQFIRFNKDLSGNYTGWEYELWPGTTWKSGGLQFGSISYLSNLESIFESVTVRDGSGACVNTDVENHILFSVSSPSFQITNEEGQVANCVDGVFDENTSVSFYPANCISGSETSNLSTVSFYAPEGNYTITSAESDTAISKSSITESYEAHIEAGATITFEEHEETKDSIIVSQLEGSKFELVTYEDIDMNSRIYVSGIGGSVVEYAQNADSLEVTGATELVVENRDGNRIHVVGLDTNTSYGVLLGDEETSPQINNGETTEPLFSSRVIAVDAAGNNSAAILEDGSLWVWGCNTEGQIGDGTYEERLSPVRIMDDVIAVSLGGNHSAALKSDGSMWVWGRNEYGQIGNGTTTTSPSPIKVLENVASISLGSSSSAAVLKDGSLLVWGYNGQGDLGLGEPESLYDCRTTPTLLTEDVKSVSLGNHVGGFLTLEDELWTWGANALYGNVGNGTFDNVYTPECIMTDVESFEMGELSSSAAIKTDGTLWTWGTNSYGMLGDGETGDRNAPGYVMDNVSCVSFGTDFMLVQVHEDLFACGSNINGQLGAGLDSQSCSSLVYIRGEIEAISAGGNHGLAVDDRGLLYSWGLNNTGQLGNSTTHGANLASIANQESLVAGDVLPLIDISNATVSNLNDAIFTGNIITQAPIVTLNDIVLDGNWDYDLEYYDNINVGSATVVIRGKGMYDGYIELGFNIVPAQIDNASLAPIADIAFSGQRQEPFVYAKVNNRYLIQNKDFSVIYENNLLPGVATVIINGIGNYTGTSITTFNILSTEACNISRASIEPILNQEYTGQPIEPLITVKFYGNILANDSDYDVTYSENIDVGVATATIYGKGAYMGEAEIEFIIIKAPSKIELSTQTKTYTGKTLAYSGKVTKTGSSGKVTYKYYSDSACTKEVAAANVNTAGTYYVRGTVAADANHNAATSAAVKFNVSKAASTLKLLAQTKIYTGKALTYSGKVTKTGSSGKVTYRYYLDAKCTKEVKPANVKAARTYYVRGTLAADANHNAATSAAVQLTVSKAANPLTAKSATKTVAYSKVKFKAQTVAPVTVSKAQGSTTFAVSKWTTAKAKKYFTVDKSNGKVTAKKGTPKGTYKFQVKVTAKGNSNYKAGTKTVTVTIVVK